MRPRRALLENPAFNPKRYDLAKVGRYKVNKKLGADEPLDAGVLTTDDVIATIKYLVKLHAGETETVGESGREIVVETDDIDHFGNRRIRNVGELIQNQVRTGLARMERVVRERMTTAGRRGDHAADPDQHPAGRRLHQGVLRHQPAVPVHGPEQPAVGADAQASSERPRPGWSLP
ncbi:hypothetical protein LV779_22330 [Streptomyces thinghirensis]|nr:hypothetical protein [Streptomyces thinghirensis]